MAHGQTRSQTLAKMAFADIRLQPPRVSPFLAATAATVPFATAASLLFAIRGRPTINRLDIATGWQGIPSL